MVECRNWAQVRDKTDAGRTGDKVCAADPAAAPLGTDEEAGGSATPPEDIARTVADEAPPSRTQKPSVLQRLGLRARGRR